MRDLIYRYYSFIEGVKNVIFYFKTIWFDRAFDYTFIYKIHLVKLKNMYSLLSDSDDINFKKDLRYIGLSISLLERIINPQEYEIKNFNFRNTTYRDWVTKGSEYVKEEALTEKCLKIYTKILKEQSLNWWY